MEPSRSSGHLTVNFFYIKRNAYFGSSRYEESPFSEFPLPVIIISSFSFSFPSLASIYFISLFNIRSITKRTKKASRNLLKNLQFEEETSKFGQMIFFRGAVTGQSVETEAVKREEKNVIMEWFWKGILWWINQDSEYDKNVSFFLVSAPQWSFSEGDK